MNTKSQTPNVPSTQANRCGDSNNGKKQVTLFLETLNASQILAIERALKEIGEFGEVRLIVSKGHLRYIGKFKTEALDPPPRDQD